MLKGIDPLLHADLLQVLAAMGHGDEIAIVDANFPAVTMGRRVVRLDGVGVPAAAEAVCSVLPLDRFVDAPIIRMAVVDDPDALPEVQVDAVAGIRRVSGWEVPVGSVSRFDFYERAKAAFAVLVTSEHRLYGCLLLGKGVIPEVGG
jgi:L-fucose mutarotase